MGPLAARSRSVRNCVLGLTCLAASTSALADDQAPGIERARGAVVTVVARDGAGAQLAAGSGFFIDIGRIVVSRRLLGGARQAGVLYAGQERRMTAVLAEDRRAGFVLLAVDLPDGAPPSLRAAALRAATDTLNVTVLDHAEAPQEARIRAALEVPGLGLVYPAADETGIASNGSAVVDARGELIGAVVAHEVEGRRFAFIVPASRLLSMEPIGPLPFLEWSLRLTVARAPEADRAFLEGARSALGQRYEEAGAAFAKAATSNPADADAWAASAACHREMKRTDAAVVAWRRAVAAQPSNARYHHELAIDLSDAGRWEDAALEFAEVVRLRPSDAAARFNLGTTYGELRRYDDEYAAYQATLALDPANVGALKNLGLTCLVLRRYDEAITSFTRAQRLAPADPEVHTGLGVSYFDLKKYQEAIVALKRALQLAPNFAKAHFGLGTVYAASGDHAAARAECQTLRTLDPRKGDQLCRIVEGK